MNEIWEFPFRTQVWGTVTDFLIFLATLITAILLYVTLRKQREANKEQKIKNESDIIFLLLNQLETEYNNFSIVITTTRGHEREKETVTGYSALCKLYGTYSKVNGKSELDFFKDDHSTDELMSLVRSLDLIRERILIADLSPQIKKLFLKKIDLYYKTKFDYPINCILESMRETQDPLILEIETFSLLFK